MLSDTALSTEDTSSFWGYWNGIKSYIPNLRALPSKITSLMTKSTTLKARAKSAGDPGLVNQLEESGSTLASLLNLAIDIKNKIDTYMPDWLASASQPQTTAFGALWIPIALGVSGIAALAYVSYNGLQLLKDYQTQESIIKGVEQKLLTIEQAQKLIKITVPETRVTLPRDIISGGMGTLMKPLAWVIAGFVGIQLIAPTLLSGVTKRWR